MKIKILLPLFLLTVLIGCHREAVETTLGPQTTPAAINRAQNKSLAKLDPYSVGKGQSVYKVETHEVHSTQGPMKSLSKEWITQVTDVENEATARLLTTHKAVTDHLLDKDFIYEFKNVYKLPQIETTRLLDQLNTDRYSLSGVMDRLHQLNQDKPVEVIGVAFHNLQETPVKMVPPQRVKDAKNCKGLDNCEIHADLISYDVIFQMSDQSTQRHTVEWYISGDVPFFAGILKQCATSLVPVENLRVLIKQCTEVVDFDL